MGDFVLDACLRRDRAYGPETFTLPPDLATAIAQVHGPEAAEAFRLPGDYEAFIREFGCALTSVDGHWCVFDASTAFNSTGLDYAKLVGADEDDPDVRASIASLREAGIWLHVGAWHRHGHFLSCDRRSPSFGQVYDCNDGGPAYGLVPDCIFASFRAYLVRRRGAGLSPAP